MDDNTGIKDKIVWGFIQLNSYIEMDIKEKIKSADFWKQKLEESGDVAFTEIDPELTTGSIYNKIVKRIEKLKNEHEENKKLIEMLREIDEVI